MRTRLISRLSRLALLGLAAAACSVSNPGPNTPGPGATSPVGGTTPVEPTGTPTQAPELDAARIGIRVVDGVGEFYDITSGQKFVPRGVNYVDFYRNERGSYEDRVMATNVYNPDRVREAFQHLADYGYNTVRIFFDTCGSGPYCIGNISGQGLNPAYLDNMVDLMYIAGETGIHVVFTANSVPEEGGYWPYFDDQIRETDPRYGFEDYKNSDWLHPAGLEIKRRFWRDLMSGLAERQAPFQVVLGWQLTNELWLFKDAPPLTLNEGLVTISNEQTYDMADPAQKRQMVIDGIMLYMQEIVAIIKEFEPEALTTVGFFAPQFPNPTGIGGDWYVDTAPLVAADSPVDFWDFHAYYDADLSVTQQAENFGMPGHEEKPILMGETGSGKAFFPSAVSGLTRGLQWIADSCAAGFDGWLNWGYYPWPDDMEGAPWSLLDEGEALFHAMAPANQPDPCVMPELEIANVALGRPVRYSRQTGGEPAEAAVDGTNLPWNAGDYSPQWIEVVLDQPTPIQRVGMSISQWPPGDTRHQVWARLVDGKQVLVAEFNGFTTVDMRLGYDLLDPLPEVVAIRLLTLKSPSWVGWGEIEVISAAPTETKVCVGTAETDLILRRWPGPNEPAASNLARAQSAVIDGRFVDETEREWLRFGGGLWTEAGGVSVEGNCGPEALTATALPRTAPVTFRLTVPASTEGEVFLGGSFPGTTLPSWVPWTMLLSQSGATYSVTVDLPVGSQIEYVYSRGGWDKIERPESCGETIPRTLTVPDGQVMQEDTVLKWRDLDGCE